VGKGGERRGGEQGRREGEGRSPNVRDALTPLGLPVRVLLHCDLNN